MRFSVYVIGALLLIFLAVGVGAVAGFFVVGRQFGGAPTGSAVTSTVEGGKLETTGLARGEKDTAVEPSGGSKSSDDTANETSFFYSATEENSRGDYTYISDPSIDGDSHAVVLAAPTPDQVTNGTATYEHNVGVWYEPVRRRWAVFNQDRAPVPAGTTFEVIVPRASASFVHYARLANTVGSYTYLDDQLTNGKPDAVLSVTQNWNPGGGSGVYNDHPVGVKYDAEAQKWAVYNQDGALMPNRAAFNIAVSAGGNETAR